MIETKYLLSDAEVARFIAAGYYLAEPDLPEGLNEKIAERLDALKENPGDASRTNLRFDL